MSHYILILISLCCYVCSIPDIAIQLSLTGTGRFGSERSFLSCFAQRKLKLNKQTQFNINIVFQKIRLNIPKNKIKYLAEREFTSCSTYIIGITVFRYKTSPGDNKAIITCCWQCSRPRWCSARGTGCRGCRARWRATGYPNPAHEAERRFCWRVGSLLF